LWDKPGDTTGNYYKNGHPSPEVIERARENMHRKHPKTRFVNAHMATLYYDPEKLATFLDTYPNADVEVSAIIQDLLRERAASPAGAQGLDHEAARSALRIGALGRLATARRVSARRRGRGAPSDT
jgi:hypothetical protein